MADMTPKESYERVYHGLKAAANAAKQLSFVLKSNPYLALARQIDVLAERAAVLNESDVLTHAEAVAMLDRMVAKNMLDAGSDAVQ